jgi:hypothetical protein
MTDEDRWPMRSAAQRWLTTPHGLPIAVFLLLCALELALILVLNDGRLIYTLDDAYIHLALAESIAHGQYGINPGEWASPASSILWPFLLAPFALTAWAQWVPLLLNVGATVALLAVTGHTVSQRLAETRPGPAPIVAALLTMALIPTTNLVGLVFTGMEHSLQVLLAVLVPLGLAREQASGRARWWLLLAITIGPMVRYELLALALPALAYLGFRGHRRAVAICVLLLALVLGGFSYFLHSRGLPLLPSSVLLKSSTAASHGSLKHIYATLRENLLRSEGVLLALVGAVLATLVLDQTQSSDRRRLAACIVASIGMHLAVGAFGWFSRYEIYIWATALVTMFLLFHRPAAQYLTDRGWFWTSLVLVIFSFALAFRYYLVQAWTPGASNNIYLQQYQMHRFATTYYRRPVAVNDVGWVAFRNDQYVIDLWGVAAEEARTRDRARDAEWLDGTMRRHHAKLAMVYQDWFPQRPATWRRLGELKLLRSRYTPASEVVAFFVTDEATAAEVQPLLRRFAATLPAGAAFSFDQDGGTTPR